MARKRKGKGSERRSEPMSHKVQPDGSDANRLNQVASGGFAGAFATVSQGLERVAGHPASEVQGLRDRVQDASIERTLAEVATQAWRAQAKVLDPETGEPRSEMRRVARHIEAIVGALAAGGIITEDITGRAYDPGLAVKILSSEPVAGVSRETIGEMLRPSVFWNGRLIQIGEAIVHTPEHGVTIRSDER